MDEQQKAICEALKALRASRPELLNYARFRQVSGIHRPTVESTEKCETFPTIKIIEKWVNACGGTLSKFFAQFEEERQNPGHATILVKRTNKPYHQKLEELLEAKPPWPTAAQVNVDAVWMLYQSQRSKKP